MGKGPHSIQSPSIQLPSEGQERVTPVLVCCQEYSRVFTKARMYNLHLGWLRGVAESHLCVSVAEVRVDVVISPSQVSLLHKTQGCLHSKTEG